MWSDTIATRGNHQPVWTYAPTNSDETRAGTTGIYTNPFGDLITGASKLGAVPGFEFFAVPGVDTPRPFRCLPRRTRGEQTATGDTIVFKGNFTVGSVGKTGVFYRDPRRRRYQRRAGRRHQPRRADRQQHWTPTFRAPTAGDLRLDFPA